MAPKKTAKGASKTEEKRSRKKPERHTYGDEHLLGSKKVKKCREKKKKRMEYETYKEKKLKQRRGQARRRTQVDSKEPMKARSSRGGQRGQ